MPSARFVDFKKSKFLRTLGVYVPPTFKKQIIQNGALAAFREMMEKSFLYKNISFEALSIKVKFVDFVAIVFYMIDNIKRSTSVLQMFGHIMVALERLMQKNFSDLINYVGQSLINLFMNLFGPDIIAKSQSEFVIKSITHAQDFIKNVRDNIFFMTDKFDSQFALKLATFMGGVLTLPMALHYKLGENWFGYTTQNIKHLQRVKAGEHRFVFTTKCFDAFLYLVDRVLDCVKCKDITRLTYDDEFILNYKKHYNWHIHHSNCLETICNSNYVDVVSNEEADQPYTYDGYLRNIDSLIQMNKDITQTNCNTIIKKQLKVELGALEKARLNVLHKVDVNGGRDAPFAIAIVGPPAIGKTQLVQKYLKMKGDIDKELGRNPIGFREDLVYHYNGRAKYMPGFTSSHTAFVLDDLGQFKDEITVSQQGGPVAFIIDVINDNKLVTEQAELELKGKIPFRCRDVVMTSNFEDCGFSSVFPKEGGAWRRPLFMDCRVKPEYRVPGETRLAGDKENPDNFDMHEFRFRKYKNNNGVNTRVFWTGEDWSEEPGKAKWLDIYEKARFLRDIILIPYYEQQDRAKKAGNKFLNAPSCSGCKLTSLLCQCAKSQADEFEHTPDTNSDSSSASSVFVEPEDWFRYTYRCLSLLHMMKIYASLHMYSWIETDCTRAARAQNGIVSFNASHNDQDNVDTWLARKRRAYRDYFCHFNYKITGKDYLTGYIHSYRKMLRIEFGVAGVVGLISTFLALNLAFDYLNAGEEEEEDIKSEISVEEAPPVGSTPAVSQSTNDGDVEDNYWEVKYEDMTRMEGKPCNITVDQMKNLTQRNTMMLKFTFERTSFYVNAFGLYGNVAVMPRHAYEQFAKRNFTARISIFRHNKNFTSGASRFNVRLDKSNFTVYSHGKDYVTVQSPTFGCFRDMRPFLLNKPFLGKAEGYVCGRNPNGEYVEFHVKAFKTGEVHYIHETLSARYRYIGYLAYSHRPTFTGLCGAPYMIKTCNGVFIAGIHVAMKNRLRDHEVQICPVRASELNHKYETFVPMSYNGLDLNTVYHTTQDLAITQTTHPKCPLRELKPQSSLKFYGEINLPRPKLKTHVTNTIFYEPVLKYFDMLDVEFFSPKDVSARKCITMTVDKMCQKSSFLPINVNAMKKSLLKRFIRVIDDQKIEVIPTLAPLSVAINGKDGVPYWNRLPVKTSGGFAHKGSKLKYFEEGSPTLDHDLNYHLIDDIMKEIDSAHERIAKGERISAIWDITFKDEPISAEKIKKNKCRLFNSASLFFSILERQAFMWTFPLFCGKNRHLFCCAIGANATGRDWTVLRNHIVKFGSSRIIAGDYSSFDKRMEATLVAAAFDILIGMAEHVGFSSVDIHFMKAIATEVIYPITNVSGNIVEFYGTNPSGHSLTTIINSIVNCLYMMLGCNVISQEDKLNIDFDYFFEKHFSLLTYGDDNIASSNVDEFNHTRLSQVLAQRSVEYTMPDKKSKSEKFIELIEASFLKRTFVVREDKYVRAPLDEQSIIKMLTVCTLSRSISKEDQCAQIIDSACREYFQYGRKTFNKRRKFLTKLLDDYQLWGYLNYVELPTYDEIKLLCYGDIAEAQSEEIEEPQILKLGPIPGVFDPRFLPPNVIPYAQTFIFMSNAFFFVVFTIYFTYIAKHRHDYYDFYNQISWYMWFFHFYALCNVVSVLRHFFRFGNCFGANSEVIAPDEYYTDPEGYVNKVEHMRKIEGYYPLVLATAQSNMIPNELIRAHSDAALYVESDDETIDDVFSISDDAFSHYVQFRDEFALEDPLVHEGEIPLDAVDNALIYDECILFEECFCIVRYLTLYRELSCIRCHCRYSNNCTSLSCNKENISITQV